MRKKRCLAMLCVILILCSFFAGGELYVANSYEVTAEEDFIWENLGNNEIRITGTELKHSVTKIVIPEKIDGKNVVEIGEAAFFEYENLKSVVIPKTVRKIEVDAFYCSYDIEEVIVANDNEWFLSENGVLYSKDKSELCYVPSTRKAEFVIPWEVELISRSAFRSCRQLESVRFSVHEDGKAAASSMENDIKELFSECSCLQTIRVEEGHPLYKDVDGVLLSADGKILFTVPFAYEAKEYTVPDSVEEIAFKSFSFCQNIERIILPESVRKIDKMAFYGCIQLRELVLGEGIRELVGETILGCGVLECVTIPDSVVWLEQNFIKRCDNLTVIEAGEHEAGIWEAILLEQDWERSTQAITDIVDGKDEESEPEVLKNRIQGYSTEKFIYSMVNQNTVVIEGLTDEAKEDKGNREFVIPDFIEGALVVGIADGAFAGIPLTSVVLPSGLQEIGSGAFYGCNLRQIIIPSFVSYIGPRAFGANYGLERIDVEEGNKTYTSYQGCLYTSKKTILVQVPSNYAEDTFFVPESVKIIGEYAFGNNRNVKTLRMKKEGLEIREKAFWNMLSFEQ